MRFAVLVLLSVLTGGWPSRSRAETVDEMGQTAQSGGPPLKVQPAEPPLASATARLEEAVRSYHLGRRDEARRQLTAIVLDEGLDDEPLKQEARVYLGELLYTEGDDDGARRFFEQVLRTDPGFEIDHFRHPPEVCGFFDYVRAYMVPARDPEPPILVKAPPVDWTAWMPLGGLYQLSHGRAGKGTVMLSSELVMLTGSATLFIALWPRDGRTYTEGDEAALRRLQVLRGTQWGFTGGYIGIWAWSWVDANRHWRVHVVPELLKERGSSRASRPPGGSVVAEIRF